MTGCPSNRQEQSSPIHHEAQQKFDDARSGRVLEKEATPNWFLKINGTDVLSPVIPQVMIPRSQGCSRMVSKESTSANDRENTVPRISSNSDLFRRWSKDSCASARSCEIMAPWVVNMYDLRPPVLSRDNFMTPTTTTPTLMSVPVSRRPSLSEKATSPQLSSHELEAALMNMRQVPDDGVDTDDESSTCSPDLEESLLLHADSGDSLLTASGDFDVIQTGTLEDSLLRDENPFGVPLQEKEVFAPARRTLEQSHKILTSMHPTQGEPASNRIAKDLCSSGSWHDQKVTFDCNDSQIPARTEQISNMVMESIEKKDEGLVDTDVDTLDTRPDSAEGTEDSPQEMRRISKESTSSSVSSKRRKQSFLNNFLPWSRKNRSDCQSLTKHRLSRSFW